MITAIIHNPLLIHNSKFIIMITTIIHNPLLIHNSQFKIIRTKFASVRHNYDYRCGDSSKLRVKTQIIKFKAQSSMFKG